MKVQLGDSCIYIFRVIFVYQILVCTSAWIMEPITSASVIQVLQVSA